jgi:hypothetical protein
MYYSVVVSVMLVGLSYENYYSLQARSGNKRQPRRTANLAKKEIELAPRGDS